MHAIVPWGAKRDFMKGRGWNMVSSAWMRTCGENKNATCSTHLWLEVNRIRFFLKKIPLCPLVWEGGSGCWAGTRWKCWVRWGSPTMCLQPPAYSWAEGRPWTGWRRKKRKARLDSSMSADHSGSCERPATSTIRINKSTNFLGLIVVSQWEPDFLQMPIFVIIFGNAMI